MVSLPLTARLCHNHPILGLSFEFFLAEVVSQPKSKRMNEMLNIMSMQIG